MPRVATLYALALAEAAICQASIGFCVLGARAQSDAAIGACVIIAALFAAASAPLFFAMSRVCDGSLVLPVSVGAVATALCSIALARMCGERQTRWQWAGFALILLGALIRGVAEE